MRTFDDAARDAHTLETVRDLYLDRRKIVAANWCAIEAVSGRDGQMIADPELQSAIEAFRERQVAEIDRQLEALGYEPEPEPRQPLQAVA